MSSFIRFTFCFLFISALLKAQAPVEGDELIKLIGMRQGNDIVKKLDDYIGGNIESAGISITYSQNIVTRIDCYNSNNPFFPNATPFAGKLPKELDFSQTIFKAKSLFGEGFTEDGEIPAEYTLSKSFPLNDLDAYLISISFRKGKMAVFSVIYQKGDAEKAEDADAAGTGEIVIRGDDYFFMIKKNVYNKEVEKFLSTLGYTDYEDRNVRMYIKKGVAMYFNSKRQIEKIIFYSGGQPTSKRPEKFSAFAGKMPHNLKFTDSRDIVLQKAGKPMADDGNKMIFADNTGTEVEVLFNAVSINIVTIRMTEKKETEK
jgi:hypothetical protein